MITRAIEKCFQTARKKWWNKTYWAIDIHETIIEPNYDGDQIPTEWYPFAKQGLEMLSDRKDVCLIAFTCSWPKEIVKYREFFEANGINFEYANENPEVPNNAYGYYKNKPYWNVLFEDKAGFDPLEWEYVIDLLRKTPVRDWSKPEEHIEALVDEFKELNDKFYSAAIAEIKTGPHQICRESDDKIRAMVEHHAKIYLATK